MVCFSLLVVGRIDVTILLDRIADALDWNFLHLSGAITLCKDNYWSSICLDLLDTVGNQSIRTLRVNEITGHNAW